MICETCLERLIKMMRYHLLNESVEECWSDGNKFCKFLLTKHCGYTKEYKEILSIIERATNHPERLNPKDVVSEGGRFYEDDQERLL